MEALTERNKSLNSKDHATSQSSLLTDDLLSIQTVDNPLNIRCQASFDALTPVAAEPIDGSSSQTQSLVPSAEQHLRKRRTDTERAKISVATKKQLANLWIQFQDQRSFDWYAEKCNIKSSSARSLLWRLRKGDDITKTKVRGRRPMVDNEAGEIIMEALRKPGGTIFTAAQALAAAQRPVSVPTISRALRRRNLPALNTAIPLELTRAQSSGTSNSTPLTRQAHLLFLHSLSQALKEKSNLFSSENAQTSDIYSHLMVYITLSEWNFGPYKWYGTPSKEKKPSHSFSRKSITKLNSLTAIAGFPRTYSKQTIKRLPVDEYNKAPPTASSFIKSTAFGKLFIGKPDPAAIDQWFIDMLTHFTDWQRIIFIVFNDVPLTIAADSILRQRGYVITAPHVLSSMSPLEYLAPHISSSVHTLDFLQQQLNADTLLEAMSEVFHRLDADLIQEAVTWSFNSICNLSNRE